LFLKGKRKLPRTITGTPAFKTRPLLAGVLMNSEAASKFEAEE
jgi:hypothetical protein